MGDINNYLTGLMRIKRGRVYKAFCNQKNSVFFLNRFMPVFSLGNNLVKQGKDMVYNSLFPALTKCHMHLGTQFCYCIFNCIFNNKVYWKKYIFQSISNWAYNINKADWSTKVNPKCHSLIQHSERLSLLWAQILAGKTDIYMIYINIFQWFKRYVKYSHNLTKVMILHDTLLFIKHFKKYIYYLTLFFVENMWKYFELNIFNSEEPET